MGEECSFPVISVWTVTRDISAGFELPVPDSWALEPTASSFFRIRLVFKRLAGSYCKLDWQHQGGQALISKAQRKETDKQFPKGPGGLGRGVHTLQRDLELYCRQCNIATGAAAPKKAARRSRLTLLGKPPGHSLLPSLGKRDVGATNLTRHQKPLSNQSCGMLATRSPVTHTGWRSDVTGQ